MFNDRTTRFFCRGYFFTKQPMPKTHKAMDLSMLHLGAKGRLNSPNFQRRSKGRPRKKNARKNKFSKITTEREILSTSTQQGSAWYWCLPGASQMRFTLSKSDYGEGGVLQRVNKKSHLCYGVVTRGFIETSPFLFQWTGISTKLKEPALNTMYLIRPPKVSQRALKILSNAQKSVF